MKALDCIYNIKIFSVNKRKNLIYDAYESQTRCTSNQTKTSSVYWSKIERLREKKSWQQKLRISLN
jgi:hypothetical protein